MLLQDAKPNSSTNVLIKPSVAGGYRVKAAGNQSANGGNMHREIVRIVESRLTIGSASGPGAHLRKKESAFKPESSCAPTWDRCLLIARMTSCSSVRRRGAIRSRTKPPAFSMHVRLYTRPLTAQPFPISLSVVIPYTVRQNVSQVILDARWDNTILQSRL